MAAAGREVNTKVRCRAFNRGSCRWGENCRFSHERKFAQICRHFQNGFCVYGEKCSYQHVLRPPHPPHYLTGRRVSEPCILPHVPEHNEARRGSEPSVPPLKLSVEHKETLPPSGRENWALAAEFIPRHSGIVIPGNSVHSLETVYLLLNGQDKNVFLLGLIRSVSSPTLQHEASISTLVKRCEGIKSTTSLKNLNSQKCTSDLQYERSRDVVCGICMDKVYEKQVAERVFGILPNCSHAYCVGCIKRWRKTRDFQNEVIKGCPQCRIKSSYFIPNKYWVGDSAEKAKLIETFKAKTSKIRCRFFIRGNGHCPFKSECIYLHEIPSRHQQRKRREQRRRSASALTYSHLVGMFDEDFTDDEDIDLLHCALTLALIEDNFELGLGFSEEVEILWGEGSDSE
uniref:RING-type E3 ubiquitin transferase n=1 Tax=Xenopus tropicalis TaxID=8364 RepID=F6TC43_XENTR